MRQGREGHAEGCSAFLEHCWGSEKLGPGTKEDCTQGAHHSRATFTWPLGGSQRWKRRAHTRTLGLDRPLQVTRATSSV